MMSDGHACCADTCLLTRCHGKRYSQVHMSWVRRSTEEVKR